MNWYYAIKQEQKGPVSEEEFQQLVRAGTITPKTLVWQEGMPNWVPHSELNPPASSPDASGAFICAECGQPFSLDDLVRFENAYVCAACKPIFVQRVQEGGRIQYPGAEQSEEEVLAAPYEVEIGECLSRGWDATTSNAGTAIAAVLILGLIYLPSFAVILGIDWMVSMRLGMPPLQFINTLLSPIIVGPLTGGFLMFGIAMVRSETPTLGSAFRGFSCFWRCVGCAMLQSYIVFALFYPIGLLAGMSDDGVPSTIGAAIAMLFAVCVAVYLTVGWVFSYQLVVDKGYGPWEAMSLSRKVVSRRWWMTFLFYFVAGFIAGIGALLILVGLLFTMPAYAGMIGALYEDNLGRLRPKSA